MICGPVNILCKYKRINLDVSLTLTLLAATKSSHVISADKDKLDECLKPLLCTNVCLNVVTA
jgi:hypothetical protein